MNDGDEVLRISHRRRLDGIIHYIVYNTLVVRVPIGALHNKSLNFLQGYLPRLLEKLISLRLVYYLMLITCPKHGMVHSGAN